MERRSLPDGNVGHASQDRCDEQDQMKDSNRAQSDGGRAPTTGQQVVQSIKDEALQETVEEWSMASLTDYVSRPCLVDYIVSLQSQQQARPGVFRQR